MSHKRKAAMVAALLATGALVAGVSLKGIADDPAASTLYSPSVNKMSIPPGRPSVAIRLPYGVTQSMMKKYGLSPTNIPEMTGLYSGPFLCGDSGCQGPEIESLKRRMFVDTFVLYANPDSMLRYGVNYNTHSGQVGPNSKITNDSAMGYIDFNGPNKRIYARGFLDNGCGSASSVCIGGLNQEAAAKGGSILNSTFNGNFLFRIMSGQGAGERIEHLNDDTLYDIANMGGAGSIKYYQNGTQNIIGMINYMPEGYCAEVNSNDSSCDSTPPTVKKTIADLDANAAAEWGKSIAKNIVGEDNDQYSDTLTFNASSVGYNARNMENQAILFLRTVMFDLQMDGDTDLMTKSENSGKFVAFYKALADNWDSKFIDKGRNFAVPVIQTNLVQKQPTSPGIRATCAGILSSKAYTTGVTRFMLADFGKGSEDALCLDNLVEAIVNNSPEESGAHNFIITLEAPLGVADQAAALAGLQKLLPLALKYSNNSMPNVGVYIKVQEDFKDIYPLPAGPQINMYINLLSAEGGDGPEGIDNSIPALITKAEDDAPMLRWRDFPTYHGHGDSRETGYLAAAYFNYNSALPDGWDARPLAASTARNEESNYFGTLMIGDAMTVSKGSNNSYTASFLQEDYYEKLFEAFSQGWYTGGVNCDDVRGSYYCPDTIAFVDITNILEDLDFTKYTVNKTADAFRSEGVAVGQAIERALSAATVKRIPKKVVLSGMPKVQFGADDPSKSTTLINRGFFYQGVEQGLASSVKLVIMGSCGEVASSAFDQESLHFPWYKSRDFIVLDPAITQLDPAKTQNACQSLISNAANGDTYLIGVEADTVETDIQDITKALLPQSQAGKGQIKAIGFFVIDDVDPVQSFSETTVEQQQAINSTLSDVGAPIADPNAGTNN